MARRRRRPQLASCARLAAFALLLGITLAAPFVAGPLGRLAGLAAAPLLPTEARLTRGALTRDRSRTALTVGALAVAIAVLVALAGVAGSTRQAATSWLVDVVPGQLLLTSIRPVAADEPAATEIAALPGVALVSPMARFSLAVDGARTDAAAVVGADLAADGGLTFVAGDPGSALAALDAGGAAIVPRSEAERNGLVVGSQLMLVSGTGPLELEVVGIAEHTIPGTVGGGDPRRVVRTRRAAWASWVPTRSRSSSSRARRPPRGRPSRRPPGPTPSSRHHWPTRPGRSAPRSTGAPSCSPPSRPSPCSWPPWASSTRSR